MKLFLKDPKAGKEEFLFMDLLIKQNILDSATLPPTCTPKLCLGNYPKMANHICNMQI